MSNIPYQNKPITITTQEQSLITQHKLLTLLGLVLLLTSMILTTLLFTPQQALAKDSYYSNEMFRLYNPNSGEHFYTASPIEKLTCERAGWRAEGIGWYAPEKSNDPVYRVYNPNSGDHHYTLSANEKNALVELGWKYEGIGWYSSENHDEALYRSYNPNAETGNHNYTRSKHEADTLQSIGWHDEGIGWYGVKHRSGKEIQYDIVKDQRDALKTKYNYNVYFVGYSAHDVDSCYFYYYVDTNNPAPFSKAIGTELCSLYGGHNDGKAAKFEKPNRVFLSDAIHGPVTLGTWADVVPNEPGWSVKYDYFNIAEDYQLPDYAPAALKNKTEGHIIRYLASIGGHDFDKDTNRMFAECVNTSLGNVVGINPTSIPIDLQHTSQYRYNVLLRSKELVSGYINNNSEYFFVENPTQWKVQ